jgi:hypothetical protein
MIRQSLWGANARARFGPEDPQNDNGPTEARSVSPFVIACVAGWRAP